MSLKIIEINGLNIKHDIIILLKIELFENEDNDQISMTVKYQNEVYFSHGDCYFSVFQELKDKLLKNNIGLQCYGSLINVHASAIMCNVAKAYFLKMGEQALNKDIINIFEYINIHEFATKQQQNEFYNNWLNSITNKIS
jgi:O-phosphoseryl-tRNA(Cys) synthetase